MRNKFTFLLFLLFLAVSSTNWAQSGSQRLKNEQVKLEQQIATTKGLLEKSKKNTNLSLEEVNLIGQQVENRERLLQNIDNQIRSSELEIQQKESRIQELNAEIERLKKQYSKLLIYAYKKRSKYGQLMFIFSAKTVEEALKRKLYLEKLADIQKKQMRLIQQNQELLKEEIITVDAEKVKQVKLASQKKVERAELIKTKQNKEEIYKRFQEQEDQLLQELKEQQEKKAKIEQAIAEAIQKEIAVERAAEKARKKKEEEERRKAEAARRAADPTKPPEPKEEKTFELTPENTIDSQHFTTNKGKLPWPVKTGTITLDYGRHRHPNLPNVYTQNNGIDISTTLNANVLSVFKGKVTSVINIPGAGKAVIIKHGDFRTVYANLQDVYVTKGSTVDTKTPIGSLLPTKSGDISVVHFEIHQITENTTKTLNPNLWIAR